MTNWKGVVDELAEAKKKAQRLYDDMKPTEAARILTVHGERAQETAAIASFIEDPVVVKAVFEVATAMIEVGKHMDEQWREAVASTPSAIRTFFYGGDIDERIDNQIDRKKREKEIGKTQPDAGLDPLTNDYIIRTVTSLVADEFGCPYEAHRLNDLVFEVPIEDGIAIEVRIKRTVPVS